MWSAGWPGASPSCPACWCSPTATTSPATAPGCGGPWAGPPGRPAHRAAAAVAGRRAGAVGGLRRGRRRGAVGHRRQPLLRQRGPGQPRRAGAGHRPRRRAGPPGGPRGRHPALAGAALDHPRPGRALAGRAAAGRAPGGPGRGRAAGVELSRLAHHAHQAGEPEEVVRHGLAAAREAAAAGASSEALAHYDLVLRWSGLLPEEQRATVLEESVWVLYNLSRFEAAVTRAREVAIARGREALAWARPPASGTWSRTRSTTSARPCSTWATRAAPSTCAARWPPPGPPTTTSTPSAATPTWSRACTALAASTSWTSRSRPAWPMPAATASPPTSTTWRPTAACC